MQPFEDDIVLSIALRSLKSLYGCCLYINFRGVIFSREESFVTIGVSDQGSHLFLGVSDRESLVTR